MDRAHLTVKDTDCLVLAVAEQLVEFVGPLAIYGDVNEILEGSMARMKVRHS